MTFAKFRAFSALLAAACLSGCAVLTVDVDVYKGVLSNEQSTQVNQLNALVPASRSLLVQMFNDLPINTTKEYRVRLRVEEAGVTILEKWTPKGRNSGDWKPLPARKYPEIYPHDLDGDELAQQRIAIRIATLVGRFDSLSTTGTSPRARALELSKGQRAEDGVYALATKASAATARGASHDPNTRELIANFRDAMSQVANEIVLLNQFGNFGQIGLTHRVWTGIASVGRNGGQPSTADALMLLQALGNSILSITDELSHRENWDKSTRQKALNDLDAVRKALYADESVVREIWQTYAKEKVIAADAELKKADADDVIASNAFKALSNKEKVTAIAEKVEARTITAPGKDEPIDLSTLTSLIEKPELSEKEIQRLFTAVGVSPEGKKSLAQWKKDFASIFANYDAIAKSLAANVTTTNAAKKIAESNKQQAVDFEALINKVLNANPPAQNAVKVLYDKLQAGDQAAKFNKEVAGLRKLTPTLDLPELPNVNTSDLTQSQVTDALVTTLRAYRLRLLLTPRVAGDEETFGLRTKTLDQLKDALDQIEGSRAESIPLRPAGAILRTASPVTAFQTNASRGSGNMLTQFTLDTVPVAGPMLKSIGSKLTNPDYNPELELRLDREFWQPINHIELQGTGKTNYAVIKDDVGNWYVKSYSADPEVAMKSFSKFLGSYYVPVKGLGIAASAAASAKTTPQNDAPSDALKNSVEEKERQQNAEFAESLKKLETSVSELSKDDVEGVTKPKADWLKQQLAAVKTAQKDKPKELSQALLALGKDYGLQRLAAAAQSQSTALADQTEQKTLLDHANTLLKNDPANQGLIDSQKRSAEAKEKADKRVEATGKELTAASAQLDAFKGAAKAFFKERAAQLEQQETFLREKLLDTIKP